MAYFALSPSGVLHASTPSVPPDDFEEFVDKEIKLDAKPSRTRFDAHARREIQTKPELARRNAFIQRVGREVAVT